MRRILFLILITFTGTLVLHAQDSTDTDGIPANCESVSSYANPLLFPRYTNGTLALINWSSGEAALILEQNSTAPNFWFVGWSPDCHYLAGGLGDGERYTTIIWDVLTGARIGTVEDGYRRPHFLTWSPRSDALVVETRNGAFLWDFANGTRLQLTIDSLNGLSFHRVTWNYETGILDVNMMGGQAVSFSLDTGYPLNIPLDTHQYVPSRAYIYDEMSITAPNSRAPYGCESVTHRLTDYYVFEETALPNAHLRVSEGRLIVRDEHTYETLAVLDSDFTLAVRNGWARGLFSPHCDMFFTYLYMDSARSLRRGVVIRLSDGVRIHTIDRILRGNDTWDPTGRYLFVQSYDGAQIWDSVTDSTFYVTTPEESARYGFSVDAIMWDIPTGRVTLDMLFSRENRVIDLVTGQRVS